MTKSNMGKKKVIWLTGLGCHGGNKGRNLEIGTEAETVEEHCLLHCSYDFLNYLLYIDKIILLRDFSSHGGLDPPKSSSAQENAPTDITTG